MKTTSRRAVLALSIGLFAATAASSALADGPLKADTGTIACGGNYAVTGAGVVKQAAYWTLRNHNDATALKITGFRIYDARGALIYDSSISGLPPSDNGVLGSGNSVLEPHQTVSFSTDGLLAANVLAPLPGNRRPIELNVDWAADSKAVPLTGGLTRITRSGTTGGEISRAGFACQNIRIGDN